MEALKKIVVFILTWEARLILKRYGPKIIAVTGNVGKTTTKDAIYCALAGSLYVRKSEKSLNSEIGVPLSIIGAESGWRNPLKWTSTILKGLLMIIVWRDYPQWLVLEVGADRPGDIRNLAKWLRPDIAVITGVPDMPVHVEYFESVDALVHEKKSLAEYLRPGGKLILCGDDPRMREVQQEFRGASVMYGIENFNDFSATEVGILYETHTPSGMYFRAHRSGSSLPLEIQGALGRPRVLAALAALAVGEAAGVDIVSCANALKAWTPPPGRLRIIAGIRGSTIIDDTYNSSPAAALSALDTLAEIKTSGRKFAVLGDMLELGKHSADAHRAVGARAASSAHMLITVGFRARAIAEAALDSGLGDELIRQYEKDESERAGQELQAELGEGDVVLVKGSQSMRMERTVYALMAEPEKAKELLVRQDIEWARIG